MGSWTERDIRPFARTQRDWRFLLLRHIFAKYGYTQNKSHPGAKQTNAWAVCRFTSRAAKTESATESRAASRRIFVWIRQWKRQDDVSHQCTSSRTGRVQSGPGPSVGLQSQHALYTALPEVVEMSSGSERTCLFGLRLLRCSGTRSSGRHESTASSHSRQSTPTTNLSVT